IFGNKTHLIPGQDDEKLLQCLELSDLSDSYSENEYEDIASDEDFPDLRHEDEGPSVQDPEAEILSESDSEDEPLSKLRKKLLQEKSTNDGKQVWKKMGMFVPPAVRFSEPEDTTYERRDWTIENYISMYFDDSDFIDICHCTNVRFLQEKGKPMSLVLSIPKLKCIGLKRRRLIVLLI
ncbi:unnamed protein product, partial [Acanthoscelides obtectus]